MTGDNPTHLENRAIMRSVAWSEVEVALEKLHPAEGGYSDAQRGFVTIGDGRIFFC